MNDLFYCRNTFPITEAISAWPDPHVTWTILSVVPGVSYEDMHASLQWGFDQWRKVCGIQPEYVETAAKARVHVLHRAIDGPGGILAECELPQRGSVRVRLWFDTGDAWLNSLTPQQRKILMPLVGAHELGHGVGMGHAPQNSDNIMAPAYNPKILVPGPWEIAEMQRGYGKPSTIPQPTPTPSPIPPSSNGGNFMSSLLKLLQLLTQLAPLIEIITKLSGNMDLTKILEVLKKLSDAFATQPQSVTEAFTLGLEKESLKVRMGEVLAVAKVMATWTTTTDVDDKIVAVLEQALLQDWLLDLIVALANRQFFVTDDLLATVS